MIRKVLLAVLGTVLGAGLFVAGSAGAQPAIAPAPAPAAVPQSREQVALSFAPVVRQTAPAVVTSSPAAWCGSGRYRP